MATTVRPRRSRAAQTDEMEPGAIEGVIMQDDEETAEGLNELLGDLRSVANDDSEVLVYKAVEKGGKWAYIKTLVPPIETRGLFEDLRTEWGGGEYFFRVRSKGRIVTTKRAFIGGDPNPIKKAEAQQDGMRELMPLLLNMQQASSDKTMQMMTMMMTQQNEAANRQMTMMMGLIPALMSGKDTPAALLSAIAPLMQRGEEGGLGKTLELLTVAKTLVGGDGGGGGDDDMFTTLIKTMGPGVMDTVSKLAGNAPAPAIAAPQSVALPAPSPNTPPPMFAGNPALQQRPQYMAASVPAGTIAHPPMVATAPPAPVPEKRDLIDVLGEDVLFYAQRNLSPGLAAEAVLERLDNMGVPESELMALVVQFSGSPDWIAELAARGYDLTGKREWAGEFISELVKQYTEDQGADTASSGDGGRETDPGQDGGISA